MSPDRSSAVVPDGSQPPVVQLPLIRYSHIFSSAVREQLENELVREASGGCVTPRQMQLLRFVDVAHHHIDDVAKFLDVTGPAATKAVDKLERGGFLRRTASDDDRRVRYLSCSEKGRQLVDGYRALEEDRLTAIVPLFTADEIRALGDLLERFALALLTTGQAGREPCLRCAGYFDAQCPVQPLGICPFGKEKP